jgi:excisionase family DNA binding protein
VKLLNLDETAKLLRTGHEVLRRWSRAGKIPALKVGEEWRFDEDEIISWLKATSIPTCDLPIVIAMTEERGQALKDRLGVGHKTVRFRYMGFTMTKSGVAIDQIPEEFLKSDTLDCL